jgi:hypothetical protein
MDTGTIGTSSGACSGGDQGAFEEFFADYFPRLAAALPTCGLSPVFANGRLRLPPMR